MKKNFLIISTLLISTSMESQSAPWWDSKRYGQEVQKIQNEIKKLNDELQATEDNIASQSAVIADGKNPGLVSQVNKNINALQKVKTKLNKEIPALMKKETEMRALAEKKLLQEQKKAEDERQKQAVKEEKKRKEEEAKKAEEERKKQERLAKEMEKQQKQIAKEQERLAKEREKQAALQKKEEEKLAAKRAKIETQLAIEREKMEKLEAETKKKFEAEQAKMIEAEEAAKKMSLATQAAMTQPEATQSIIEPTPLPSENLATAAIDTTINTNNPAPSSLPTVASPSGAINSTPSQFIETSSNPASPINAQHTIPAMERSEADAEENLSFLRPVSSNYAVQREISPEKTIEEISDAAKVKALNGHVEALRTELSVIKEKLEQERAEKDRLSIATNEAKQAAENTEGLKTTLVTAAKKITDLETTVVTLESKIKELEADKQHKLSSEQTLNEDKMKLEQMNLVHQTKITDLEQQLNELSTELTAKNQAELEHRTNVSNLESEMKELKAKLENAPDPEIMSSKETEIARLKTQTEQLVAENKELRATIDERGRETEAEKNQASSDAARLLAKSNEEIKRLSLQLEQ
ncbi:MAG: hypothetical protein LBF70_02105, partial [Holosporales bacterium]|nr:hypothetical protein [Holosporales bacterium]